MRVDLPAFGLPARVTNPLLPAGVEPSTDEAASAIVVLAGLRRTRVSLWNGAQSHPIYATAVSFGDLKFEALVFQFLADLRDMSQFVNDKPGDGRKIVSFYFLVEKQFDLAYLG